MTRLHHSAELASPRVEDVGVVDVLRHLVLTPRREVIVVTHFGVVVGPGTQYSYIYPLQPLKL